MQDVANVLGHLVGLYDIATAHLAPTWPFYLRAAVGSVIGLGLMRVISPTSFNVVTFPVTATYRKLRGRPALNPVVRADRFSAQEALLTSKVDEVNKQAESKVAQEDHNAALDRIAELESQIGSAVELLAGYKEEFDTRS